MGTTAKIVQYDSNRCKAVNWMEFVISYVLFESK